jgi:hypothetical protein
MAKMAAGGARYRVDRLDAHQSHQALNALAINLDILASKLAPNRPAATTWIICVEFRLFALDSVPGLHGLWFIVVR